MEFKDWIYIAGTLIGFCLLFPFVVFYIFKLGNPFDRYLDWVYNIVNKRRK
jgi:hypothetical protein